MKTQTDQIIDLMKSGHKLTALDALKQVGCFRLAARIAEVKAMGYPVSSDWVETDGKRYKRYFFVKSTI